MSAPSADVTPALPLHPWLLPLQAATYLGVAIADFLPLVESGQLVLHRAPDQSLRIHRDRLDAVLLPVPPSEAARLLAAETSSSLQDTMAPTEPSASQAPTTGTLVPLKDAASQLNQPYKTLLRLVHAGKIPVTNLGTASRPRFMVDPHALQRLWTENGQREMRRRSAPSASLDYSRLLSQPSKGNQAVRRE